MSITSVSSSSSSTTSSSSSLTDSQKKTINELLADYDSDNFTTTDSEALLTSLSKAGISVNSTVLSYLKKQGFDVLDASSDDSSSSLSDILNGNSSNESVSDLLTKLKNGEITKDELRAELLAQMPTYYSVGNSSSSSTGNLLNITA